MPSDYSGPLGYLIPPNKLLEIRTLSVLLVSMDEDLVADQSVNVRIQIFLA